MQRDTYQYNAGYNSRAVYPYNTVNKNVGDTIYMTATGSGGVAPYNATFTSSNTSGVIVKDTSLTGHYVVVAADANKTLTFYATVTDSCTTPMTSAQVSSTAIISGLCVVPGCGFVLS